MLTKVPAFAAYSAGKSEQAAASKPVAAAQARSATAKQQSKEFALQTVQDEEDDYVLV